MAARTRFWCRRFEACEKSDATTKSSSGVRLSNLVRSARITSRLPTFLSASRPISGSVKSLRAMPNRVLSSSISLSYLAHGKATTLPHRIEKRFVQRVPAHLRWIGRQVERRGLADASRHSRGRPAQFVNFARLLKGHHFSTLDFRRMKKCESSKSQ
jgi:hypothetical protein